MKKELNNCMNKYSEPKDIHKLENCILQSINNLISKFLNKDISATEFDRIFLDDTRKLRFMDPPISSTIQSVLSSIFEWIDAFDADPEARKQLNYIDENELKKRMKELQKVSQKMIIKNE
jgi:hypothetical protein